MKRKTTPPSNGALKSVENRVKPLGVKGALDSEGLLTMSLISQSRGMKRADKQREHQFYHAAGKDGFVINTLPALSLCSHTPAPT